MATGDIFKLSCVGQMHGHTTVNTFHYRQATGEQLTFAAGEILKNGWMQSVGAAMLAIQSNQYQRLTIEVQAVFPLPVTNRVDFQEPAFGQVLEPSVPDSVAMVIRRRGVFASRASRGRIYVPGVSISQYDEENGRWVAFNGAFVALADAMVEDVSVLGISANFEQVLFKRVGGTFIPIVDASYDNVPRSQRRRQLGVGA